MLIYLVSRIFRYFNWKIRLKYYYYLYGISSYFIMLILVVTVLCELCLLIYNQSIPESLCLSPVFAPVALEYFMYNLILQYSLAVAFQVEGWKLCVVCTCVVTGLDRNWQCATLWRPARPGAQSPGVFLWITQWASANRERESKRGKESMQIYNTKCHSSPVEHLQCAVQNTDIFQKQILNCLIYTGASQKLRISWKSSFISVIQLKLWNSCIK